MKQIMKQTNDTRSLPALVDTTNGRRSSRNRHGYLSITKLICNNSITAIFV